MKKLLLLASTAVTAALMVSCSQGTDTTTPPGPTTDGYTFTTVSDAVYYGEKYAEGSGFYTFALGRRREQDAHRLLRYGSIELQQSEVHDRYL